MKGNSSSPEDSAMNPPSAEELKAPTDESPPQLTGGRSNKNGSETTNEVEKNGEMKPSEEEDRKNTKDLLEEIKMQKSHDLYCRYCIHNITQTAEIVEKGKENFPYNKEKFVLSFVIVLSFKYPFIFLPWLYNNRTRVTKKHVLDWLRLAFVVVLLLLSAIFLLVPPSQPPTPPTPPAHSSGSSTIVIPDQQKIPEEVTEIDASLKPHGTPDDVKPNNLRIPSPPLIKNKGGWISRSGVKDFSSNRVLALISLLLLAILAMCLHFIPWTKSPKQEIDAPAGEIQSDGDKGKKQVHEGKQDVAPQNDGLIAVISQTSTSMKHLETLRNYIMVTVKNILLTELDILKSIVYGGLIESITSFGVVSSAAGSGTSTVNVLALGLANLSSGLFLIIYNLYGLVNSQPFNPSANIVLLTGVQATDSKDDPKAPKPTIDPYVELLGKRKKTTLHCVVVVVSFIFFGVIPLFFYGLAFKITDNRHYEAAVFVSASLVCVISLSFGKAHAFKMNKPKTVVIYTGIAIGASALSFIGSQHIRALLDKYDFH
ncbi:unnamed protein product [Microthlaspi erraticum]|uniref:Uncharacterized protein n=1 Tax=Microthlaspi erraticum TaxID=1685480 RepID=A0A6D2IQH4_9BRAS|nr:unnamed protein product [Microthlaspi erraticum]